MILDTEKTNTSIELPINDINVENGTSTVATYLNVSANDRLHLEKRFPLRVERSDTMFNKGSFRIRSTEEGLGGEITVKDGTDSETVLEESMHYLQTAANVDLQKRLLEINHLYEAGEREILLSIDESLVVADRARQITIQELDGIATKLGLETTHAPQSTEEIKEAILLKVGNRENSGYYSGGTLSAGESIRINSALDRLTGNTSSDNTLREDIDRFILRSKALAKLSLEANNGRDNEEITGLRDGKTQSGDYIRSGVASKVTELIETPGSNELIEDAFNESHIEVDNVTFRTRQLSKQVDALSSDQSRECILKYINSVKCNSSDLLYISQLIPGKWNEVFEILRDIESPGNRESRQATFETLQLDLANELASISPDKMNRNPKEVLIDLIRQTQSISSTQAGVETNLIYLMDDFPSETGIREALLSNPKYIEAYIMATLSALKSGEFTPLNIKLDTGQFSSSEDDANHIAQETLTAAFSEPEVVIFFQELVKKADYERYRSPNADVIAMYGNWQLDMQFIADGIDLREPISIETYSRVQSKAQARSFESIKRKQEMNTKVHMRDVLIEPIAKVLVQQKLGGNVTDVEFPKNMMGGYSELLRSGDSRTWVTDLWRFLEKIHGDENSGGKTILEFFACSSIADQQKVVKRYLEAKR